MTYLDEISNKEIDLGKYTEENFELKDQNKSLEEELNRSQSECSQLRDHVHSLSMNQTGLQDAPDGDVRGSSLFQGTGNFFSVIDSKNCLLLWKCLIIAILHKSLNFVCCFVRKKNQCI